MVEPAAATAILALAAVLAFHCISYLRRSALSRHGREKRGRMRKKSDGHKKSLPPSAAIVLVVALVAVSGFVLLFLSLAPSAGNRAGLATAAGQLRFVTPITVPYDYTMQFAHGSELFTYDPGSVEPFSDIGNIYFGSDTNYNERGIKAYTNPGFYQKDGKTAHYRLVDDDDPLLCYAVVEDGSNGGAAGDERLRKAAERVTFDVRITDAQGNIAHEASERNCRPRDYLKENQYACHYQLLPAELAVEQLRGNRFSCEMTVRLRDAEGDIIAEETAVSEKPVAVADITYHVTSVVHLYEASAQYPYEGVLDQYDYLIGVSHLRPQESLDDPGPFSPYEKLGKLVFHEGVAMDIRSQVVFNEERGACLLRDDHVEQVIKRMNEKKSPAYPFLLEKEYGDNLIAVSNSLMQAFADCVILHNPRKGLARNPPVWEFWRRLMGHAPNAQHYVILQRGALLPVAEINEDGTVVLKEKPKVLAHELGHASWPQEPAACDEYLRSIWGNHQRDYERRGMSCPNIFPPCCSAEGDYTCADTQGKLILCLGMPDGYSGANTPDEFKQFRRTPDSRFSIMGVGDWYPDYFPAPLGKAE